MQSSLDQALPLRFDFYDLGFVELQTQATCRYPEPSQLSLETAFAVGFYLWQGTQKALVVLCFQEEGDPSLYSELGNILSSQLATQLQALSSIETWISPPQILSQNRLSDLMQRINPLIQRTYLHHWKNSVVPFETLILPLGTEEIGNA